MKIVRTGISSLLPTMFLFLFCATAFSQGTNLGTIRGTVTDPNGAAIPNASVQISDQTTGISRDLTTDGQGDYEAAGLKPGTYKITISATGFKTTSMDAVVKGSDVVRADIKAEVGTQTENVTVSGAEAGLIEKDQAVIAGTINNRTLIEVPRDSRDIYEFLYLNPDITQGVGGDGTFKFIGAQSYGAAFSLDGQRSNGGIFGEPTASQPSLETIGELTVLSKNFTAEYSGIANIRVVTKRGGKDYHGSLFYNNKNSALAAWTIQDKNAQAGFSPTPVLASFPTPYFNLNETGGSFSGPVPLTRGRTFFLGSYERRWDFAPVRVRPTGASLPPTPLIRGGNFSVINASARPVVPVELLRASNPLGLSATQINDILANSTQVASDVNGDGVTDFRDRRFVSIPSSVLNPIALNIVGLLPQSSASTPFSATTGRVVDFVQNLGGLITRDLYTARIDHDFGPNDKLYVVYNYQRGEGIRSLVASPVVSLGLLNQTRRNHTLSISYSKVFSNTLVNELRGGYNIQNLFRKANQTTQEFLSTVGFNDAEIASYGSIVGSSLPETPGQVAFTIGSFTGIPSGARNVNRPLDQHLTTFGDTLSWATGNHAFKFGADFVKNQAVDGFAFNRNDPRGTIIYPNNLNGFARFLIGLPPSSVRYVNKVRPALDVSNWENGFFAQDDWRIHPRITLNLGVRYEYITPFIDKNNLLINFDPKGNGGKGRLVIPTLDIIPQIDQRFVNFGVVSAKDAGVGRGLVNTDKNNIAPRLGVAWRLTNSSVLRGGYGLYYPTSAAQGMRDAFASSAFNQRITKNSTTALPLAGLPGGVNPRGTTPFSGGSFVVQGVAINAIPFDLQSPRIEQFNVTFEQEVKWNTGVRVSFVGSRQHNLIAGIDLNMLPPNTTPFGVHNGDGDLCTPGDDCEESAADSARRPFPALGSFLASYGNIGRGNSKALQFEVNRRFARGLTFNASYTLLDQKSSGLDTGNSTLGGTIYNQFHPENDLSRDSFISRHRFISYGALDLPFGRGRAFGKEIAHWADAVAGGWQLTWNMFAKSGTGFTPFITCNNCDPVWPGNIASDFVDAIGDFNGQGFRPLVVGDPYANLSGDRIFNPAAFAPPSTGADVFDNPKVAKRNVLTGPGTWGMNLGVHKFFSFNENTKLEVGADFNNVFNHPLRSPLTNDIVNLGDFDISLDAQGRPVILPENVNINPDFGRTNLSFSQEGIDNRRSVRLRLRLTF